MAKRERLKWIGPETDKLAEIARGKVLQAAVYMETIMDMCIASYFVHRPEDDMLFREFQYLILGDMKFTFGFKQTLINHIIRKIDKDNGIRDFYCMELYKMRGEGKDEKLENFNDLFDRLITRRNAFAHRKYDVETTDKEGMKMNVFLWEFKINADGKSAKGKPIQINDEDIEILLDEFDGVIRVIKEIYYKLKGLDIKELRE